MVRRIDQALGVADPEPSAGGGRLPLLVAVSGPPAAGKSSVAVRLGSALALPVVSRDALKTGMLFTEPAGTPVPYGGEHSVRSWDLFSVMTSRLLEAGVSLVIEQAFLRGRGEAFFEPFLPRSRLLLVQCDVSREESLRRFRRRIADPTRQNPTDVELLDLLERGTLAHDLYEPLDLSCPVLRCDTTDIGTAAFDARLADLAETIRVH